MVSSPLIVLLILCYSPLALSREECLKGESFWCQSFENAVACSALKHCTNNAWKTGKMTSKEEERGCQKCLEFAHEFKTSLHDMESMELIRSKLVNGICASFGSDTDMCTKMFDKVVKEAFDALTTRNDAAATCQEFGECDFIFPPVGRMAAEGERVVEEEEEEEDVGEKPMCKVCKFLVKAVKDAIGSNPTRDKVKHELDKICDKAPKIFRKECKKVIDKNVDKLIDQFMNKASPEKICSSIKLCSTPSCPDGGDLASPCETCEIVVSFMDGMTSVNFSSDLILRSTLERSCSMLPCKYREPCFNFKKEFGENALNFMKNKIDQDKICSLLDVCKVEQPPQFKCISGPQFWCSSPTNAKLCEAESHCKEYYWKA